MSGIGRRSKRIPAFLLTAGFAGFCIWGQVENPNSVNASEENVEDIFAGLIESVLDGEPEDSVFIRWGDDGEMESFFDMSENSSFEIGALDFVEDFYSEHGYYDTGNWSPPRSARGRGKWRYIPYRGRLPEYEYSDFKLPAEGKLTSRYGYRPRFGRMHYGVDISLEKGDTVVSSLPGVVVRTGYDSTGYGRFVVVAHSGDMEILYGHLSTSLVNPGQELSAGTPIGIGGNTGNSTGPHLHFETRLFGIPLDPLSLFPSLSQ